MSEAARIPVRCVVKGCSVHLGGYVPFHGEFCQPCWEFITHGTNNHSSAYRNSGIPALKAILKYFEETVKGFYAPRTGWMPEEEVEATTYLARLRSDVGDAVARAWLTEHQRIG